MKESENDLAGKNLEQEAKFAVASAISLYTECKVILGISSEGSHNSGNVHQFERGSDHLKIGFLTESNKAYKRLH